VSALAACCEKRNGLKTILSTFGLIFLAELGDRTQLACIGLTCKARSPLAVFLGAVGALAVVTLNRSDFWEKPWPISSRRLIFGKHLESCSWSLGLRS
jgi:hypothetical protein